MNAHAPAPRGAAPEALDAALAALRSYDWGSSRAALLPLDQAVAAAHASRTQREMLERRLLEALQSAVSVPAREYLCSQLALVGGKRSVAALAGLLGDPHLATAARHALEAIPDASATRALRRALSQRHGRQKIGVIISLAVRRDAASARAFEALLGDADAEIAAAAAWALGELGTPPAASALARAVSRPTAAPRESLLAAALSCAQRLVATGRRTTAEALCRALTAVSPPEHVRAAAERILKSTPRQ